MEALKKENIALKAIIVKFAARIAELERNGSSDFNKYL